MYTFTESVSSNRSFIKEFGMRIPYVPVPYYTIPTLKLITGFQGRQNNLHLNVFTCVPQHNSEGEDDITFLMVVQRRLIDDSRVTTL